jgi:hypothetical protein
MDPSTRNNRDRELRDLFAAYRDVERMSPSGRAAAWRRLQAELDAPSPARAPPRPAATTRPLVWGALLLAAAALLFLRRSAELVPAPPRDHQSVHDAAAPAPLPIEPPIRSPQPRPPEPAPITASPAPARPLIDPPAPTRRPSRSSEPAEPPATPSTDLEQELALLRTARDALTRGDHPAATAALADHARRFPSGHLREERLLLHVEALCAAGAHADARREAAAFAHDHPTSPHAKKILRVCP